MGGFIACERRVDEVPLELGPSATYFHNSLCQHNSVGFLQQLGWAIDMRFNSAATGGTAQNGIDADRYALSGKYNLGNIGLGIVYTAEDLTGPGAADDVDSSGFGLFADYDFSNRTKVYAAYADTEADVEGQAADDESDKFSIGVVHSF
jgi:predicted porin